MGKQTLGREARVRANKTRRMVLLALVVLMAMVVYTGVASATPVGDTLTVNVSGGVVCKLVGADLEIKIVGVVTISTPVGGIGTLVINGGAGADSLTLDFSGGFFTLPGGITFNGLGGNDTLSLTGAGLAGYESTYTPGGSDSTGFSGTYSAVCGMQGLAVYFTGLEPVIDSVPATTLTINAPAATTTASLTTASGYYVADFGGIAESISFKNKTNVGIDLGAATAGVAFTMNVPAIVAGDTLSTVVVNGAVDDTYTLTATPSGVTTTFYGLAGNDTFSVGGGVANSIAGPLTLNGGPGDDTFNLGQGTLQVFAHSLYATGVSGNDTFNVGQGLLDHSFSTSFELQGGDGDDTVSFSNSNSAVDANDMLYAGQLTHGGILPLMYAGMEALAYIGGSGADILRIVDTHSGSTSIEGRGGDDVTSVNDCSGSVSMVGGSGLNDELSISVTGLAPVSWAVAATSVTSSLFTSPIGCDDSTTELLSIFGGPGPDTFVVSSAPIYTELYLYGAGPTLAMGPPWDSVDCPGTMTVLNAGNYYGKFTNAGHADVYYEAVELTPVPLAEAAVSATPVDEGQSVSFTGTVYDSDSTSWAFAWDFGDGTASTQQSPTHAYADNGSYTATFTATDGDSNIGSDTVDVTVGNVAPVVDAGADQSANPGETVTFSGSFTDAGSGDTHTIAWDFGDGGGTTGTLTPTHVYSGPGTYTVTLTVTDDDGGTDSDTLTATVSDARSMRRQATDLLVAQLSHLNSAQARVHANEALALRLLNLGSSQFVDGSHLRESTGATLFAKDKQAIQLLRGAIGSGKLDAVIGAQVISLIVESDRLLAQQAIDEATAAHGNASLIAQAQTKLAAGDTYVTQDRPDLAVEAYGAAWGFAVRAY